MPFVSRRLLETVEGPQEGRRKISTGLKVKIGDAYHKSFRGWVLVQGGRGSFH